MLKLFLLFTLLFTLSCTSNKTIKTKQKTEDIIVLESLENKNKDFYVFYEDLTKESLLVDIILKKVNKLGFTGLAIPVSKISEYQTYYKSKNYNVLFFLGNTIYNSKSILKKKYDYLIIDTPNIKIEYLGTLSLLKTTILTDADSLKYLYSLIKNKDAKIDLRYDKYAWLLNENTKIEELIPNNKNFNSRLRFKKEGDLLYFDRDIDNKLLIFFTKDKVILEKCNKSCSFDKKLLLNSVYIPINRSYEVSKKHIRESIIIKKIFKLISQELYLDSYLLLLENKNSINSNFFKKTFDFMRKQLYNLESDLIRRYDGEYKQGNANR